MSWRCLFWGHSPYRLDGSIFIFCRYCAKVRRIPLPAR